MLGYLLIEMAQKPESFVSAMRRQLGESLSVDFPLNPLAHLTRNTPGNYQNLCQEFKIPKIYLSFYI